VFLDSIALGPQRVQADRLQCVLTTTLKGETDGDRRRERGRVARGA
jgi:hypothetical protein